MQASEGSDSSRELAHAVLLLDMIIIPGSGVSIPENSPGRVPACSANMTKSLII
jgi:hypothetical protein